MSANCAHEEQFDGTSRAYRLALWLVIAINGAMFFVEFIAGSLANSRALQADALDFFGDTLTYVMSMSVIGSALATRARAALVKGIALGGFGIWVLGSTLWDVFVLGERSGGVMSAVALLALAANLTSVLLLLRFRDGDANVRSVWICSRNDALGNIAVAVAGVAVLVSGSPWPDVIAAALMAGMFVYGALTICRHALRELQAAPLFDGQRMTTSAPSRTTRGVGGKRHDWPLVHRPLSRSNR